MTDGASTESERTFCVSSGTVLCSAEEANLITVIKPSKPEEDISAAILRMTSAIFENDSLLDKENRMATFAF